VASISLEICVDDLSGIEAAVDGGADRIELCSALELGGLTPSPALIRRAVATGLPVHAMIRPRVGNFRLEPRDVAMMADDIRQALDLGATGVVAGALLPDRTLDRAAMTAFRKAAGAAVLVLHRAIDLTPDPIASVGAARDLGVDKILSSGGARTAIEGAITLACMVAAAGDALGVIAGSGVRPDHAADLIARTGVREVHSSASVAAPAPEPEVQRFGFGGHRRITDPDMVRRLRAALRDR
jgi:copper homeostasis protein